MLPPYKFELYHKMLTEVSDILHNVFDVAYKRFTHQYIATVPRITGLEQILYKHSNSYLWKNTVKLIYFDCVFDFSVYFSIH